MTSTITTWRHMLAVAVCALVAPSVVADATGDTTAAEPDAVCNSLTGPFCVAHGASSQFAAYMTPIPIASLYESADESAPSGAKKCFFQHFARSWMDNHGEENDLMHKDVRSVDECEALCCAHPQCQSFSFWMGQTCFLRARRSSPRADGNSFSGNRIG